MTSPQLNWLSGKVQSLADVPARKLVTVYENPQHSPTGEAFVVEEYSRHVASNDPRQASRNFWKTRFLPTPPLASRLSLQHKNQPLGTENGLTLIATMATWCVACVEEMPWESNAPK